VHSLSRIRFFFSARRAEHAVLGETAPFSPPRLAKPVPATMQPPQLNPGDVHEIIVNNNNTMNPVLQCIGAFFVGGGEREGEPMRARSGAAPAMRGARRNPACAPTTTRPDLRRLGGLHHDRPLCLCLVGHGVPRDGRRGCARGFFAFKRALREKKRMHLSN
jgi:hypothetical protein